MDCSKHVMRDHCYWPLVSDLSNLLSHRPVALQFLSDDSLLEMWFSFLSMFQGDSHFCHVAFGLHKLINNLILSYQFWFFAFLLRFKAISPLIFVWLFAENVFVSCPDHLKRILNVLKESQYLNCLSWLPFCTAVTEDILRIPWISTLNSNGCTNWVVMKSQWILKYQHQSNYYQGR